MSTKLSVWCDKVIEAGWLAALVIAPLFFNVHSSRVFEPDKLTLVRSIAVIMAAAWLVRWAEERSSGKSGGRLNLRTPLVLPTLLLVIAYLISTLFSVTPRVSLWGSYQRLQGTYTTFSYIVIFLLLLEGLRRREQVDRLINTVIVTSLPIAFYGLIQHYAIDPLPWGGDVTKRVAANMGNAIFIAAYLIMAFFLTLGRVVQSFVVILTEEAESSLEATMEILRASAYIFIMLIQVVTIYFSQSRGPWLGWAAGLFAFALFGLLTLRRLAADQGPLTFQDVVEALLTMLGSTILGAGLLMGLFLMAQAVGRMTMNTTMRLMALTMGGIFGGALVILALAAFRRTWKWLWLSWILQTMAVAGFLVVFNLPSTPLEPLREAPYVGRLGKILETETGTGKVRVLIWQGALRLFLPHEPIVYPDGTPDRWNLLRPLIGYGPEAMYVAYNRFYPPDLAHYEARNASPDRSHNETFDALIITGLLGYLAEELLFLSVFYYGLKWLGWIRSRRQRNFYLLFFIGGGVIGVVISVLLGKPYFLGVGAPFGQIAGLILYLIGHALFVRQTEEARDMDRLILILSLLAAVMAHFVEIHFGIAIAATRTYFWAFAGLMVVVGQGMLQDRVAEAPEKVPEPESAAPPKTRRSRRRRRPSAGGPARPRRVGPSAAGWLMPVLAVSLVLGLILATLAYDFITTNAMTPDVRQQTTATEVLRYAFTVLPPGQGRKVQTTSPMVLLMFTLTWLLGGLLFVADMVRQGRFQSREGDLVPAVLILLGSSLALGLGFALYDAGLQASIARTILPQQDPAMAIRMLVQVAGRVGSLLTGFYLFVGLYLAAMGAVLVAERRTPPLVAQPWGLAIFIPALLVALVVVAQTNLRVIQADIYYKQGEPWNRSGQWDAALAHFKQAIRLAPNEDFYYLWTGSAFLEKSKQAPTDYRILPDSPTLSAVLDLSIEDTGRLSRVDLLVAAETVLKRAREINPLNTDHSANLARLYKNWADMAKGEERQKLVQKSIAEYETALTLSPNAAHLWNELAIDYLYLLGEPEKARALIEHSLSLDDRFDQTYMILGDFYLTEGKTEDALAAYQKALEVNPRLTNVYLNVARLYQQQGEITKAIQTYQEALARKPKFPEAHYSLGQLYESQGEREQAILAYQQAVEQAPKRVEYRIALANLLAQEGQFSEALRHVQAALEQAPDDPLLRRSAAILQAQMGQLEQAIAEGERAYQLAPTDPSILNLLADLYRQKLALNPQAADAWSTHWKLAQVYQGLGRYQDGLNEATTAYQMAPPEQRPALEQLIQQLQGQAEASGGG